MKIAKHLFLTTFLFVFFTSFLMAQVSINTDNSDPDPSAMLDISSSDKGILIPRLTTAIRMNINTPATGLLVFDTDTGSFWFYNGTVWTDLSVVDDADADATNELNTSIVLNGTDLETTDGGGTITTDLSGLQDVDWLRTNGEQATGIGNSIYTNGNVGIGTDSPSFPIDIQGTSGERLRAYSKDNYYAGLLAKNDTREFFIGVQATFETNDNSSGFHIYDNTVGSQRFVIDKDGNIGINQANPNAKLHVNGDFRLVDGTQGLGKVLTSDESGFASWTTLTDNVDDADADPTNEIELPVTDGTDGQFLQTDGAGTVSWATHTDNVDDADADPTNELITSASLNGTALEIIDNGGTTSIELNSLVNDEDWTYNAGTGDAGEIYHSGQVSIGSTTASNNGGLYRLYSERQSTDGAAVMGYNGTSRGMLGVWNANFPDVDLPLVQSVGVLGYAPIMANNNRAAIYGYTENTAGISYAGLFQAIGVNAAINYGIYVNAANSTDDNFSGYFLGDKSYFEGNIGLGTTAPETKLHVNGTILAGANTSSPHTTTLNGSENILVPGSTSDYLIAVQDGNGRVQHKWNATYGTGETFVVGGEDAAFIDITADASSDDGAWLEFKHADGSTAAAGDAISWNSQLMINQGGEVGINESSPDDMLHVTSGGNGTRLRAENTGNGWAGFLAKNTEREIFIGIQGAFDANPGELHIYDNTAGARRMVISAAGNVGIGRNNPSVKLDVNGSVNCTGGTCSSDIRWKKDIQPLENALNNIMQLRGVNYDWRREEFPTKEFTTDRQIGLIAQEVEAVYPELVKTDATGFKAMDYMSFSAVLLEAVKTLKTENDQLKQSMQDHETALQQQETTLNDLKTQLQKVNELEQQNQEMKAMLEQIKAQLDTQEVRK